MTIMKDRGGGGGGTRRVGESRKGKACRAEGMFEEESRGQGGLV